MESFFVRGLILGFAIAAPVGPIGLLCIARTLAFGRMVGLVSGLGAASADALYGFLAAFGLTLVTTFLVRQAVWLGLLGGLFLCYLGVRTWRSMPPPAAAQAPATGLTSAYLSTFLLTLTNPMTVLAFVAIFAGAGLAIDAGGSGAAAIVFGVFCGSAAWWLMLSVGVSLLRDRLGEGLLRSINRLSGLLLIGFGLYALTTVWR